MPAETLGSSESSASDTQRPRLQQTALQVLRQAFLNKGSRVYLTMSKPHYKSIDKYVLQ